MKNLIRKIGPGLLFAGASVGVSHLVQSTRVGAEFGWGLLWILILVNILKYPFFQFGPRFALATQKSLLDGYAQMNRVYLWVFFFLSMGTMFTIQTAVTVVTAGLASKVFGLTADITLWSVVVTFSCLIILLVGRYKALDKAMRVIVSLLSISTLLAIVFAVNKNVESVSFEQIIPKRDSFLFLAAFIGWMPAPLDISVWHSLWTLEKNKEEKGKLSFKEGLFDFNVGYLVTVFLAIFFMSLGALVMYNSNVEFSNKGGVFASQLINLYTSSLGEGVYYVIAIAALTTMLSTTLTTLDASPRAMAKTTQLLFPKRKKNDYLLWIFILTFGTGGIFIFFLSEMGVLIQLATVLSFVVAPFYAFLNYKLVTSEQMPKEKQPSKMLKIMSVVGLIFLSVFSLTYLLIF